MEHGNAWLRLDELGSNVRIKNITPAEALVLRKKFGVTVPGQARPTNPLTHLEVLPGEHALSDSAEYDRLVKKYGPKAVTEAFPGEVANLPKSFDVLLEKDPDGNVIKLPERPAAGPDQLVVALQKIPRDDGSDLEPATAAKQAAQTADVAKLQAQVELLTKLVAGNQKPPETVTATSIPPTPSVETKPATTEPNEFD